VNRVGDSQLIGDLTRALDVGRACIVVPFLTFSRLPSPSRLGNRLPRGTTRSDDRATLACDARVVGGQAKTSSKVSARARTECEARIIVIALHRGVHSADSDESPRRDASQPREDNGELAGSALGYFYARVWQRASPWRASGPRKHRCSLPFLVVAFPLAFLSRELFP